ncbi:putative glycolipid-binding domain-containing protein [Fulvimarina sp. MAC3]|uniref:putative glycolipid-binding domain-containing protein n=1 Tax=Fulvimarina sp. MAC3 TaxID=3148887 RepID=UPI0031FD6372
MRNEADFSEYFGISMNIPGRGVSMHVVLWRRLDVEGHDACRYLNTSDGWAVEGTAVFEHAGTAACLTYRLLCDREWRSRSAAVSGWIGERRFELALERENEAEWRINGLLDTSMTGLNDIDLGFTPASNTNAIRRLELSEGSKAESVAVWLDTEDWIVKRLPQSYNCTGARTFDYASPRHDYHATLLIDDFGAVIDYPHLWTRESRD